MIIHKIDSPNPSPINRLKVAAYVRVSKESERLSHSLSAQISYYNELIQGRPDWEFAGVYVDQFISGTGTDKREDFQRMLADCEAGKIDVILTKSISRFARNTVDLLNTVRHLKELGISVRFDKENIDSMTTDGELMLTVLAGFAEEEIKTISSNIKWSIHKKFENGEQWSKECFGYRWDGETFVIQEDEANAVREMYRQFLTGNSFMSIMRWVNEHGFPEMTNTRIKFILQNEIYKGDLLLQKNFTPNPLTHKRVKNRGELPQYYVSGNHEAIVSDELWQAVQDKIKDAHDFNPAAGRIIKPYEFTKKITCCQCGNHYTRNVSRISKTERIEIWYCYGKIKRGKDFCPSPGMREDRLKEAARQVLGLKEFDSKVFSEQIEQIFTTETGELEFRFYDGTVKRAPIKVFEKKKAPS